MSARKDGPQNTKVTHVRRCHVCGTVNELEGSTNLDCQHCGKHLAPFYFFDESSLEGLSESGLHASELVALKRRQPEEIAVHPIWGLSTYWTEHWTQERVEEDIKDEADNRRHQSSKSKHQKRHSRHRT